MPTPEQLRRQADAVARVRAARVEKDRTLDRATKRLNRAIRDAHATGVSVKNIAIAADVSPQWIYEVLKKPHDS